MFILNDRAVDVEREHSVLGQRQRWVGRFRHWESHDEGRISLLTVPCTRVDGA